MVFRWEKYSDSYFFFFLGFFLGLGAGFGTADCSFPTCDLPNARIG
jgi:hypothetical protein